MAIGLGQDGEEEGKGKRRDNIKKETVLGCALALVGRRRKCWWRRRCRSMCRFV